MSKKRKSNEEGGRARVRARSKSTEEEQGAIVGKCKIYFKNIFLRLFESRPKVSYWVAMS